MLVNKGTEGISSLNWPFFPTRAGPTLPTRIGPLLPTLVGPLFPTLTYGHVSEKMSKDSADRIQAFIDEISV